MLVDAWVHVRAYHLSFVPPMVLKGESQNERTEQLRVNLSHSVQLQYTEIQAPGKTLAT